MFSEIEIIVYNGRMFYLWKVQSIKTIKETG